MTPRATLADVLNSRISAPGWHGARVVDAKKIWHVVTDASRNRNDKSRLYFWYACGETEEVHLGEGRIKAGVLITCVGCLGNT